MKYTLSKRISDRRMAQILTVLFIISIIPMLWVSAYGTPRADDFTYGALAHRAMMDGKGLTGILRGAWETVVSYYIDWQGTFASIFIFALQPGVFGTQYYGIGGWILLFALIGSTLYLTDAVFCRWLGMPKSWGWLIGLPVLISEIQFMPDSYEGLYWFNGASYYLLPFAAAQVLAGLLITMKCSPEKSGRMVRLVLCLLLAVFVGGGNYVSVLVSMVLLATAFALSVWKKSDMKWYYLIVLLTMAAFFTVSAAAPGNLVRGGGSLGSRSPLSAILLSFVYGWNLLKERLRPGVIAVCIFILPLLMAAARKCEWKFQWPVLAVGYGFCVLCTQYTSTLYAGLDGVPGRMACIHFYLLHLWLVFSLFYLCGWGVRTGKVNVDAFLNWWKSHFLTLCIGICILFAAGTMCWSTGNDLRTTSTVEATVSVIRGHSQETYREFMEQEAKMLNARGQLCYIRDLRVNYNVSLHLGLIADDDETNGEYWINKGIADYYGCTMVLLDVNQ